MSNETIKIWQPTAELTALLAELTAEAPYTSTSVMVLDEEEEGTMTLLGSDVAKLLASQDTIDRFYDAIGRTSTAMVEIRDFEASDDVVQRMEELFDYVEVV